MSTPSRFPPSMAVLAGALLVASGALATSCGESDKAESSGRSFCCALPAGPPPWTGDVVVGDIKPSEIGGRRRTPAELRAIGPPSASNDGQRYTREGCALTFASTQPGYYEIRLEDGCPYWYPNPPPDAGDAGFN